MLIQIRGTSGSGKSWVSQKLFTWCQERFDYHEYWEHTASGRLRTRPSEYLFGKRIYFCGQHETPCSGVDNNGASNPRIYENYLLPRGTKHPSWIFLCEGLLFSEDVKWTTRFIEETGSPVVVYYLSTPREVCLEQLMRRKESGRGSKDYERIDMKLTKRIETINRTKARLEDVEHVTINEVTALQAYLQIRWILKHQTGMFK